MQIQLENRDSIWSPQPGPQTAAVLCPADVIAFGGARGGGKTDCALGRQVIGALTHGHDWNGLFLRKHFKHFADLRRRIDGLIRLGLPAIRVGGDNQTNVLKFENGAKVMFTAVERPEQLEFFQGQSIVEISIEEAVQFGFLNEMIDKLKACLRSAAGVKCSMFLTANPGGPGHSAFKARFISPAPGGGVPLRDGDDVAVFIPSRVEDNAALCENDPKYVERLKSIRDPQLRRAWLEGDWDAVVGGFFDDVWQPRVHVVRSFRVPRHWPRLCGMDWGSAKPFSVGWYAVSGGDDLGGGLRLPRGALVRYNEWYGCVRGEPDTGLRLTSDQVAEGILERERQMGEGSLVFDRIADTSIFDQIDGPSIGERFAERGVVWRRADKRRLPGWEAMRSMLRGHEGPPGNFTPWLYFTDNCRYLIETLPTLQRDENNWEDLESDNTPDHAVDEVRYVVQSRAGTGVSYDEYLMEEHRKAQEVHNTVTDWEEIESKVLFDDYGDGPAVVVDTVSDYA